MEFAPSWDLFIIVFFAVVIAYSFIIGRNETLKIIIASYIAILTSDGVGNIIEKYIINNDPSYRLVNVSFADNSLPIIKITIFVLTIVLIAIRGRFNIDLPAEKNKVLGFFTTTTYGVLSAGLLIATILIYASGVSFVEAGGENVTGILQNVYESSLLVRIMIDGYSWWFSLPAIIFVISSLFSESSEG